MGLYYIVTYSLILVTLRDSVTIQNYPEIWRIIPRCVPGGDVISVDNLLAPSNYCSIAYYLGKL